MFLEEIKKIEDHLDHILSNYTNNTLRDAIAYSLKSGGKRLRPLLVILVLEDLGIDIIKGINQACAIEMIHTYSLIHDDLPSMDDDNFRRGKPTLHKVFGEAVAILAADALLTDSFSYFLEGDISDSKKIEISKLASQKAGGNGMVLGQVLDMNAEHQEVSLEDVEQIHMHKTKNLIQLGIMIAAIIADVSYEKKEILNQAAYYFGLGFQIKDDIMDAEEGLLKSNSDLKHEKATYPKVLGIEKSKEILNNYKIKALELVKSVAGKKQLYALMERIL